MRLFKNIIAVCGSVLMLIGGSVQVNAEDYTYTVTFDPGAGYGTITNDLTKDKEYSYGDSIPVLEMMGNVEITDKKYYFRGWHVSGIEGIESYDPTVTKDIVYVATYGIAEDLVSFTCTFTSAVDGSQLAAPVTFYGNAGEERVMPYLFIEGYEPQAYNLKKTLSTNEAENVFPFVYTPIEGIPGPGGTTYTYVDEGGTVTYVTVPGGGGGGAAAGGGAAPAGGGVAPAGGGGAGPAVIPDDQTPAGGPEEIIDLDDQDTPAGEFSPAPTATATTIPEPGTPGGGLSNAWKIALATGGGIGLLLLLLLLLRRKDNAE